MAAPSESHKRLFQPQTVAVLGSVKSGKLGHQLISQLLAGGFSGRLLAVNPGGEHPEGFPQVPAIRTIQEDSQPIDLALITVPARYVEEALKGCGARGVPWAVIFSAGFSEVGRTAEEERIARVAREQGVRVIGPNCAGFMNSGIRLYASIEVRALPGSIALVTQSGALGGALLALAKERGIGFSKFVSLGNRLDMGEAELLSYLAKDKSSRVIALHVESLQNGRDFLRAAAEVTARKPLVVLKGGRSASGSRAIRSHTGSLAGSDEVFEAALGRVGGLRVNDLEELLDLCYGFTRLEPLAGKKIAIVTNSGGPGVLTADCLEGLGLEVAESDTHLKARLRGFLSSRCSLDNPVDLTVEGSGENYRKSIEAMIQGGYQGVIAINVATPFLDSLELARGIAAAGGTGGGKAGRKGVSRVPIAAVFMAGDLVREAIQFLQERGLAVFPTGERAAKVFSCLHRYRPGAIRKGRKGRGSGGQPESLGREPAGGATTGGSTLDGRATGGRVADGGALDERATGEGSLDGGAPGGYAPGGGSSGPVLEPEAVAFLRARGFPLPDTRYIRSPEELSDRGADLGFPLAVKVVSPEVIHKSDCGGVRLNIRDPAQLASAYRALEARFADRSFQGVLLYPQIRSGVETIVGLKRDRQFGPVILVGAGGLLTELIRDVAFGIAPLDRSQALEMIATLKINRLYSGYRGRPAVNRQALAELLVKASRLALQYPSLEELDLNPVFVSPRGVTIVDVRLILS